MCARGNHTGRCFRWRCFHVYKLLPVMLEMLQVTCHLLIGQPGPLWCLHVSGSYCTMCQVLFFHLSVFTGTRFVLPLAHVSILNWIMCHIFIGPRGHFLFDHASRCYPSTFHFLIWPRRLMTSFHVSDF
jgi:hypothetical protein